MSRIQACLLVTLLTVCGTALLAQQTRSFTVEEKPAEILGKQAGIGERYALLVGISKYANSTIDLNFAADDATALQKLLLDPEVGAFNPDNVRLLINEQATRRNVMSALNTWLGARVRPEDSVLIFYSGHGALGPGQDAYWVTHDADVEDLFSSALGNKEISRLIAQLPAKRKLTLIDSCFSEATAKSFKALVPADVFQEFKGEGVVTITASTGQEKSVEVGGHGAFTFHLLDALQGKADGNSNGVVELDEVWNYLSDRVQKTAADAGNRQTPVFLADRLEHGFPLTINPAKAAGATLTLLKQMYSDGKISVDEIGEAERLFTQRDGNPELRKLYLDMANNVLTPVYFRQLRQLVAANAGTTASAPAAGPSADELAAQRAAREAEERQRMAENMAYEIAKASDTERGYEQYLVQFPAGPRVAESRRRLTELQEIAQKAKMEPAAYIVAESQNTEEGWGNFIKQFPTSQLAVIATSRLDNLIKLNREKENTLYTAALEKNMPEDWDRYIKDYPAGRFVEEAMRKRTDAVRRVEEENMYKAARAADSLDSWKAYADKYPAGAYLADARRRVDQLTWLAFADVKAVPAGSFVMGNEKGDGDEKPQHRVDLDAFMIGRSEVTNAQFLKFVEETRRPAPRDPDFVKNYMATHPDLPVVNVTYADALAFCQWLSQKTGATARLPSEAEWEYAARSGHDNYLFPWASGDAKTRARYSDNDPSGVKTVARDAFPANEFGLFNMAGNVAEWVLDYYSENSYRAPAQKNPMGPAAGKERVFRGGHFQSGEDELRVARRSRMEPIKAEGYLGFRVVVK